MAAERLDLLVVASTHNMTTKHDTPGLLGLVASSGLPGSFADKRVFLHLNIYKALPVVKLKCKIPDANIAECHFVI